MEKRQKFFRFFIIILLIPLVTTNIYLTNRHLIEKILNTNKVTAQMVYEDNKIEEITADFAFSVGAWCICAENLRESNLRKTACPLDWMRKYSLDTVATLFETKFKNFFKDVIIIDQKNSDGNYTIYDTQNHIESIHYIPSSQPFNKEYQNFRETMQKRAKKTDSMILSSNSVILVNCRCDNDGFGKNSEDNELIRFAKRFSNIYPHLKKIYLVDIYNDENENIIRRIVHEDKKIKIIQYKFKNIDNKNFEPNWLGNQKAWKEIMSGMHLTETSKT